LRPTSSRQSAEPGKDRSVVTASESSSSGEQRNRFHLVEANKSQKGWTELKKERPARLRPSLLLGRLAALPIRVKLVLALAGVVAIVTLSLTWLTLMSFRRSLERRLLETCQLTARHLAESEIVKAHLLSPTLDEVGKAELQENVLSLQRLGIEGFEYAYIADHTGHILAHTDFERRGEVLIDTLVSSLSHKPRPLMLTSKKRLEVIYPVISRLRRANGDVQVVTVGFVGVGLSKSAVFRPLRQAQSAGVAGLVLVLFVSGFLIMLVAEGMTRQVNLISEGIREVGHGNLDVEIPVLTQDELGRLASEFNRMIVSLREKLEMQKYVSKLTVQMIHQKASVGGALEVGKRQEVTVLFCDARDFSRISETLPPEDVVALLNDYLDLLAQIVERNQGVVDKFVGDEVMAVFLGQDRVNAAVRTAVQMQLAVKELNRRRQENGKPTLQIGVGIHAGVVVAGSVGSKNRKDHTVLGDTVNVAFRLCALAGPGQIIVSEAVAQARETNFRLAELAPVRLKGKSQPLAVYEVLWAANRET